MSKSLKVAKNALPAGAAMEDVLNYFKTAGIPEVVLDTINWKEYPYCPKVSFRIAHNCDEIFLQFNVEEEGVRGTFECDYGSRPWTDSCVEFFMMPDPCKPDYYNVEMTCIGHGTFACGPNRAERHNYDDTVISRIRRVASLGSKSIVKENGRCAWSLTLAIPFDIYGIDGASVSGKTAKANFYKCGDDMPVMHFVSWNPINCPQPDFHRPECFGELVFE